mgnify:CR=1 FL=1
MTHLRNRRLFIKQTSKALPALALMNIWACQNDNTSTESSNMDSSEQTPDQDLFFKISLAQWSLNRAFKASELKVEDFASIAKDDFGITAVEYVASMYQEQVGKDAYFIDLNRRAKEIGVKNLLMMVDEEGDLGNPNDKDRQQAVENHYKWVEATKLLEGHTMRINAFGEGSSEIVSAALVDGLGKLAEYAQKEGINVVIENHGLFSSDAKWVANVLTQINMDNCGTLPDFGNFCTAKKWGSTQNNDCEEAYDRYLGVQEMMPFAKGVSAKSYDFDENGNETIIDYKKMLNIVKTAGYTGYIGIEYEGTRLSEPDGIRATKALLERLGRSL